MKPLVQRKARAIEQQRATRAKQVKLDRAWDLAKADWQYIQAQIQDFHPWHEHQLVNWDPEWRAGGYWSPSTLTKLAKLYLTLGQDRQVGQFNEMIVNVHDTNAGRKPSYPLTEYAMDPSAQTRWPLTMY